MQQVCTATLQVCANPKKAEMKTYHMNDTLTFGKYEGKSIDRIVIENPGYIDWCIIHLDHFRIDRETIEHLKALNPAFQLSDKAEFALTNKERIFIEERDTHRYHDDDWTERRTYEDYNDFYAQNQMGWSDQDINDVFGGEADSYWNID